MAESPSLAWQPKPADAFSVLMRNGQRPEPDDDPIMTAVIYRVMLKYVSSLEPLYLTPYFGQGVHEGWGVVCVSWGSRHARAAAHGQLIE